MNSPSQSASLESANPNIIPLDCLPLAQPTLPSVAQPATQIPEHHGTSLGPQHPATIATSLQLPQISEPNEPVSNWPQALLSTCVVGAAAVAVVTGYACYTVFRGAINLGQFIYANRENIQQTCRTCTQAVQSTYNAAKRRMVSIPSHPVNVPSQSHRRYSPLPRAQGRSRQRRFVWQYRILERSPQSRPSCINTDS